MTDIDYEIYRQSFADTSLPIFEKDGPVWAKLCQFRDTLILEQDYEHLTHFFYWYYNVVNARTSAAEFDFFINPAIEAALDDGRLVHAAILSYVAWNKLYDKSHPYIRQELWKPHYITATLFPQQTDIDMEPYSYLLPDFMEHDVPQISLFTYLCIATENLKAMRRYFTADDSHEWPSDNVLQRYSSDRNIEQTETDGFDNLLRLANEYNVDHNNDYSPFADVQHYQRPGTIFSISRHRIDTDGPGVTTLVAFMGCPLHCKYCINPRCHGKVYCGCLPETDIEMLTPQQLYDKLKIDDIYFQTTGGGVCFGGGEPGMAVEYITKFREICGDKWNISLETSLNYDMRKVWYLSKVVDHWIVDIKDMNPSIYKSYTGKSNTLVLENLDLLSKIVDKSKVTIKVPLIPHYNDFLDVKNSFELLKHMGFENIVHIIYDDLYSSDTNVVISPSADSGDDLEGLPF